MNIRIVLMISILDVLFGAGPTKAGYITFDSGTPGGAVGSTYASQGVTFSNAQYVENSFGGIYVNGQATPHLSIGSLSSGTFNSSVDPIVITFDAPQSSVSILAVNVGFAGARLDSYDSLVGGALVGSQQKSGTTENGEFVLGGGLFQQEEFLLSVSAPSILRVELFRPNAAAVDGVHFDNLSFTPAAAAVPEPESLTLIGIGLASIFAAKRGKKNRTGE